MKRIPNPRVVFLAILLASSMFACDFFGPNNQVNNCPLPPAGFTKTDLVGTWASGNRDTLILRADGTYKQILHIPLHPPFNYESTWLPWSITYSEGIPYVHLKEMRLCVYWVGEDCQQIGGGKDIWYDYCKHEWVQMPDEGILLVLGPPKGTKMSPPGFSLVPLQESTEGTTSYEWQGTN